MGLHEKRRVPVVLLHGAGQDAEIWADVAPLVTRPLIVHEFPAHGGRFGAPLERVEDLAEDAVAHIPGSQAAVLVGHSLGGAVALEAALRRPESVSGVVVVCTELDPKPDRRAMAALQNGDLDGFVELIHLGIVGRSRSTRDPGGPARHQARPPQPQAPAGLAREAAETSARRLERVVRRTAVEAITADYRAAAAHDLTGRLGGLEVPVAVLAGGADVLVPPRRVAALAGELDVEESVVADASHQLPWEVPAAVARAIEQMRSAVAG